MKVAFSYGRNNLSVTYLYQRQSIPSKFSDTPQTKYKDMIINDFVDVNKPSDIFFFILTCTDKKEINNQF